MPSRDVKALPLATDLSLDRMCSAGEGESAAEKERSSALLPALPCQGAPAAYERDLREMRDRIQALFASVETGIFIIDPETHRIVEANPVALSLVGAAPEKIAGAVCHSFVCPAEEGRCPVTDLGQQVDNSERVLLTVRGERLAIIKTVRPVDMGGHRYLLESFLDISARKRAEQSLTEQTAYLNTLIEVSPFGIAVLDDGGRVQLSNSALERLFLYSRQELQGVSIEKLILPEDRIAEARQTMSACLAGQDVHFTVPRRRRDGTLIEVEINGVPLIIPGKRPSILALYQDVTERRRIEAEMEERHRLAALSADIGLALTGAEDLGQGLQACAEVLVRHMSVICVRIWTIGEKDRHFELQAAAGTLGRMSADDIGVRDAFDIARIAARGEPEFTNLQGDESWLGDPDWAGREQFVAFAGCPLKVGDQILGVAAAFAREPLTEAARQAFASVVHSIAQFVERKRAEASLRESEDRFRRAFEDAPYGMCMADVNGRFLRANAALCQMLGYSQSELIAGAWQAITHPDDLDRSRQALLQFTRGEMKTVEMEKRYIRKNGEVLWTRVRILAVENEDGSLSHFITQIEDITLRRLAEDRLRASEERYRELFENASDLVYTISLDLRITSLNRLAEETMGYSREEATGMSLCDLVDPDQCDSLRERMARLAGGDPPAKFEINIRARNGRRITLDISPRLICRDGMAAGVQAIARDVTGRDVAEMELRQAQKLESVGRLASGIAHEINTPMQFIGDNVRFLNDSFHEIRSLLEEVHAMGEQSRTPSAGELKRLELRFDTGYLLSEIPQALAQTQEGVERVVTIVRAMKEFAHPESRDHVPADLNKALLNTLTVARNELKYVAEVETDFGELPLVVCSVSDLNQVFLNLLVNAAHAIAEVVGQTGEKGKIRIHTEACDQQVLITIADSGAGIPAGIRERIFDPFFTTKEVGRGTGQGLAIARSVVARHGGSLTFASEVGRGTTFFLRLPVESPETGSAG